MPIKLKPLAQQVMLITGASSGIGRVTAKAAAARGASVMLVARNEPALQEAVAEIEAAGGVAAYAVADVGDAAQVAAAADAAIARFGRIDTWVNNAGTAIYAKLVDTPLAEHEQMFRTNYFGAVNGAMCAVEHLRENGGAIITVASIAADLATPILGAYAASKHAVKGFINALRMELTADALPISITLIKPSGIDTPIAQHAANHVDGEALIPIPVYDPALVAAAILDSAEHARREITVGGVGRLQVLVGTHFPALLDPLAGLIERMTSNPARPKTVTSSMFAPLQKGQERSGIQPGRTFSVYTAAELHPLATQAVALGAIAAVVGLLAFRLSPPGRIVTAAAKLRPGARTLRR